MTVKDLDCVFDHDTRFMLYKRVAGVEDCLVLDDTLTYADEEMLDMYVSKAFIGKNDSIVCICM